MDAKASRPRNEAHGAENPVLFAERSEATANLHPHPTAAGGRLDSVGWRLLIMLLRKLVSGNRIAPRIIDAPRATTNRLQILEAYMCVHILIYVCAYIQGMKYPNI